MKDFQSDRGSHQYIMGYPTPLVLADKMTLKDRHKPIYTKTALLMKHLGPAIDFTVGIHLHLDCYYSFSNETKPVRDDKRHHPVIVSNHS